MAYDENDIKIEVYRAMYDSTNSVFAESTDDELAERAQAREEAEAAGVFDDDRDYGDVDEGRLTARQEYDLWSAMSTLSDLAKETNSTLSDLLKKNGYGNLV